MTRSIGSALRGVVSIPVVIVAVLTTGCGADSAADTHSADPMSGMDHSSDAVGNGSDMADMNMGNPDATPASEVGGAELASGPFELLDSRPQGYDEVSGTASIARSPAGTTVTVEVSGLMVGKSYIAHLHEGDCSDEGGHYRFDPDGADMPPNEIHLAFDADDDGNGYMTAENDAAAGPEGKSVVVHPVDLMDNRIACADLDPVE